MIPLGRISNRFGVLFLSVCVYVCVKHFGLCLLFSFGGGGTLYLQFTPWAHKTFLPFLSGGFVSEWTNSITLKDLVFPSMELLPVCFFVLSLRAQLLQKENLLSVKIKQSQSCVSH